MSRILFINSVCNGSTGTICKNLYKAAEEAGHECCIAFGRGNAPEGFKTIRIGNKFDIYLHVLKARLFDASGFGCKHATREFIKKIDEFKPDIIHLHNVHGYYINIEILFSYLKKHPEIKKVWTLHDCWAFTGHCAYYTYAKCFQWKMKCKNCSNKNEYPKSFLSRCSNNFEKKRKIFTNLENLVLVTPSQWLKNEVNHSFLKHYEVIVINNGVDTKIFKPTPSSIKQKYNIEEKKVILGVASVWDKRKGLDTFINLSKHLSSDYKIVLIGLNNDQIKNLPKEILGISRTENVNELVKWYSAAEVYFNPTLEDNYPTTNLEAIACGTPVVTFNTGGSPESAKIYGTTLKDNTYKLSEITNNVFRNCKYKECLEIKNLTNNFIKLYGDIYG